ncbi:MAG: acetyl-CoA carboxylase [Osedax symbiont Rs1]|nr:MAG: acetyl-CoA carboxylase [Osedax symbiont Rs1]
MSKPILKNLSDIRRYFLRNETPMYFISATNFNLLGISTWVKNFRYINYLDCFDGRHPSVFIPSELPHVEFESIEDINNYLLEHKDVVDYIANRANEGEKGKAIFLMFDQKTEQLCEALNLAVCFPSASLRSKLDNKIETVRIGDRAGVPSVPNLLSKIENYQHLQQLCIEEGLGDDLVLQTAFGDSGHTTYFISNREEYNKYAAEIECGEEIKVMKRINCRGSAIEACTTQKGTVVGPLMTELVGFKELTPYKGGWCGNEIYAGAFTDEIRTKARDYTFAFGEALRAEGYRGYFELDFLLDTDTGEVYLGELNPRVTGASSLTNHAAFAHADAPLFLFHLLEFCDVEFDFDVEALNARWAAEDNIDSWSQLVIKHTDETVALITEAPESGIYTMDEDGSVSFSYFDYRRRAVETDNEAFFLRISDSNDYEYEGADLGILITRGRLMTDDFALNDRAMAWIDGIRNSYKSIELSDAQVEVAHSPSSLTAGAFKIL